MMLYSETIYFSFFFFFFWCVIRIEADHLNTAGDYVDTKVGFGVFFFFESWSISYLPLFLEFITLGSQLKAQGVFQSPILQGQPNFRSLAFRDASCPKFHSNPLLLRHSLISRYAKGTAAPTVAQHFGFSLSLQSWPCIFFLPWYISDVSKHTYLILSRFLPLLSWRISLKQSSLSRRKLGAIISHYFARHVSCH